MEALYGLNTPYLLCQGSSIETSLLRIEKGQVPSNGRRKVRVL